MILNIECASTHIRRLRAVCLWPEDNYIPTFATSNFLDFLTLLISFIIQLAEATVISELVAKAIVSVYLLELRAETFFSIGRREHHFKLLYSFSHLLFITSVIS